MQSFSFQILDSSARRGLLRAPGGCEAAAGGRGRGGRPRLQGGHAPQVSHQVQSVVPSCVQTMYSRLRYRVHYIYNSRVEIMVYCSKIQSHAGDFRSSPDMIHFINCSLIVLRCSDLFEPRPLLLNNTDK